MDNIIGYYNSSEQNTFTLPDGTVIQNDLIELYKVVDVLGNRYGMGGCKSIEEFVDMVDKTDPMILNCLLLAIKENVKSETDAVSGKVEPSNIKNIPQVKRTSVQHNEKPITLQDGRNKMVQFLSHWGADRKEVNKAIEDFDSRKIKLSDYSWLSGRKLESMSNAEFKSLLNKMGEESKLTKDFKLTLDKVRM